MYAVLSAGDDRGPALKYSVVYANQSAGQAPRALNDKVTQNQYLGTGAEPEKNIAIWLMFAG
jgi:hypothetical protein